MSGGDDHIDATCPGCGAKGHVPRPTAPRRIKCPRCARRFVIAPAGAPIPRPEDEAKLFNTLSFESSLELRPVVEVACPKCGDRTTVPARHVGMPTSCSACHRLVELVPVHASAAAAPSKPPRRRRFFRRHSHPDGAAAGSNSGVWIAVGLVAAALVLVIGWAAVRAIERDREERRAARIEQKKRDGAAERERLSREKKEREAEAERKRQEQAEREALARQKRGEEAAAAQALIDAALADARERLVEGRARVSDGERRFRARRARLVFLAGRIGGAAREQHEWFEAFVAAEIERVRDLLERLGMLSELQKREAALRKRAVAWLDARKKFWCRTCAGYGTLRCEPCGGDGAVWRPGGGNPPRWVRVICGPCAGACRVDCGKCGNGQFAPGLDGKAMLDAHERFGWSGTPFQRWEKIRITLDEMGGTATVEADTWIQGKKTHDASNWRVENGEWTVWGPAKRP